MSHVEHQETGKHFVARCAVITCSDTRFKDTDHSGNRIAELLEEAGHEVLFRNLVPDDADRIRNAVQEAKSLEAQLIITTGGTGISRRDTTFEAIQDLITTKIPGFGELFRMLSWEEIGPAAMMSRATASSRTTPSCLPCLAREMPWNWPCSSSSCLRSVTCWQSGAGKIERAYSKRSASIGLSAAAFLAG